MKRTILITLLAAGMGAAVISCKAGGGAATRPAAIPPIDAATRETTETAAFALG